MRRAFAFFRDHRRALVLTWLACSALFIWMNSSAWNAFHAAEEDATKGQWGRVLDPLYCDGSQVHVDPTWQRLVAGLNSYAEFEMWLNPLEPQVRYFRWRVEPGYV
jgi:hypothetical protein